MNELEAKSIKEMHNQSNDAAQTLKPNALLQNNAFCIKEMHNQSDRHEVTSGVRIFRGGVGRGIRTQDF